MQVSWNFEARYAALLLCKAIQNASIKMWKVIREGTATIAMTDKDIKNLKVRKEKDTVIWDEKKGKQPQSFELDEQFVTFLREKVKELDQKNMIPSALLPLAEALGLE